jgi:hypothetical protein
VHAVDFVGRLQLGQPARATQRASRFQAKVVSPTAQYHLLHLAALALKDRHVPNAFEKRAVDPAEPPTAAQAFAHASINYDAIAPTAQVAGQ